MAHRLYCRKRACSECKENCYIDGAIPCSPDCENLTEDGKIKVAECLKSGCEEVKYIFDMVNSSDAEIIGEYGEIAEYPYDV